MTATLGLALGMLALCLTLAPGGPLAWLVAIAGVAVSQVALVRHRGTRDRDDSRLAVAVTGLSCSVFALGIAVMILVVTATTPV